MSRAEFTSHQSLSKDHFWERVAGLKLTNYAIPIFDQPSNPQGLIKSPPARSMNWNEHSAADPVGVGTFAVKKMSPSKIIIVHFQKMLMFSHFSHLPLQFLQNSSNLSTKPFSYLHGPMLGSTSSRLTEFAARQQPAVFEGAFAAEPEGNHGVPIGICINWMYKHVII